MNGPVSAGAVVFGMKARTASRFSGAARSQEPDDALAVARPGRKEFEHPVVIGA